MYGALGRTALVKITSAHHLPSRLQTLRFCTGFASCALSYCPPRPALSKYAVPLNFSASTACNAAASCFTRSSQEEV